MRFYYKSRLFKLPILRNYAAICLGYWVFFKEKEDDVPLYQIRHEYVHVDQIARHGIFQFYTIYLFHFCMNMLKYRNWDKAYREIPFEKEAREISTKSIHV